VQLLLAHNADVNRCTNAMSPLNIAYRGDTRQWFWRCCWRGAAEGWHPCATSEASRNNRKRKADTEAMANTKDTSVQLARAMGPVAR